MGIEVEWVSYGRPAAQALVGGIAAAKDGEALAPVTVVVPSNHVAVAARRLIGTGSAGPVCAGRRGLAAVTFVTVYRLAELIAAPVLAERGLRPVSTPVLAAAFRRALAEAPGVFEPVARHPATEMALVGAYRELRDLPAAAADLLATESTRAADVVRLQRTVRSAIGRRFSDEEDLMEAAVAELDRSGSGLAGLVGPAVVYLPERVSLHGAALLAALARRAEMRVVAGLTDDARADAEVARSVARISAGNAPPPDRRPAAAAIASVVDPVRTRVVLTSDADEEVRAGVRAVLDGARQGQPLERIAVLYPTPEPYARLVHEQLGAAAIPHNGAAVVPLTHRVAPRTLLGLLALPARQFHREDVFGWLAGGPIHHRGRPAPVSAWERVSREAGVVCGRQQWDGLLATLASDLDRGAERADDDPEQPAWRAERQRREAAHARELRAFVLGLMDELERADRAPRRWSERVGWAQRLLASLLGPEWRRGGHRVAEAAAAERLTRSIDRLGVVDALEDGTTLESFARTLELELDADLGRVGRTGEGVLVGSLAMGVGLDLDLVVVLGMAEGTLPARPRDDSLLPDHEREAAGGALPSRLANVERQHHQLLATLAGAHRHVFTCPRGDLRRSSQRTPSRWLREAETALGGKDRSGTDRGRPEFWRTPVASFDAGLRTCAFPATDQEHRLRSLMAADAGGRRRMAAHDPVLGGGLAMLEGRRSAAFTRFDGNLSGLEVRSPVDHPTSATRLEHWARCPFAYLLREVLGVQEVEDPEDRLELAPLDRGNLVHAVLERFVIEVLERPANERPAPGEGWAESDRSRLHEVAAAVFSDFEAHGLVGRPIFWRRDRADLSADFDRFLDEDGRRLADNGYFPVAAEFGFGTGDGRTAAVVLELPDGRTVALRGKADRLDRNASGDLWILDYKTGSNRGFTGLSEENPDERGTHLQLPVYGLAARLHQGRPQATVLAEYWFTSTKGGFVPRGYEVTDEVVRRVSSTVGWIVQGIERGVFPSYPTASSSSTYVECPYCDPDGLGVGDLRRALERKSGDESLAHFLELADPEALEAGGVGGERRG